MFYDFPITVPAGTSKDDPVITDMKLTAGVVNYVEVRFPFGPNFDVYVQINQGGHQLWPTNPDSAFRDDGRAIGFVENYELIKGAVDLTAICYSPAATYDHLIIVRLGILEAETVNPNAGTMSSLQQFLQFVGLKGGG